MVGVLSILRLGARLRTDSRAIKLAMGGLSALPESI